MKNLSYFCNKKELNNTSLMLIKHIDLFVENKITKKLFLEYLLSVLKREIDDPFLKKIAIDCIYYVENNNNKKKIIKYFCDDNEQYINCFLGYHRASMDEVFSNGFFLQHFDQDSQEFSKKIISLVDYLGERLFGFPCDMHGRNIEFYNLIVAKGPLSSKEMPYIAMFSPWYLSDNTEYTQRRSILFSNIISLRFKQITAERAKGRIFINGKTPKILYISDKELRRTAVLWVTLHEMMHGSGPLPLFNAPVRKIPLGLPYAGIEEMRADMTVWLACSILPPEFKKEASFVQEFLLLERIFRSFRNYMLTISSQNLLITNSDHENGFLWFSILSKYSAITFYKDIIYVDLEKTNKSIKNNLDIIYEIENEVAQNNKDGEEKLLNFSQSHRGPLVHHVRSSYYSIKNVIGHL